MAKAKNRKPYYLYGCDSAEWSIEKEADFDYIKLLGNTIYYLSRTAIDGAAEITDIPVELTEWLTAYETQMALADNEKKAKKAAKSLEKSFREELDRALILMQEEAEQEKAGGDTT